MTSTRPPDPLAVASRYADPSAWPVPLRFDPDQRWSPGSPPGRTTRCGR